MEAESDDGVETELANVRRRLDALVKGRLARPFSVQQQAEFDRLVERERDALALLARRRASARNCADDQSGQLH